MKVKALQLLERAFSRLGKFFTSVSERCAVCPDCGRNRYKGMSCIVMQQTHPCDMGSRGGAA